MSSPTDTTVHPNVRFVIDAHEKLEQADMSAIAATFQPDIVWHEFGDNVLAGSYSGIDNVMAFWKTYFMAAGMGFRQDITEIMANDAHVTSIVHLTGRKSGVSLDQTAVDIMRMSNGKIAEFWRYYADLAAAHNFLLSPD